MKNGVNKLYTVLTASFVAVTTVSNIVYKKFITIPLPYLALEISVGAVLFPITFFIMDFITEFFGKENAKFCIILSAVINVFVSLFLFSMICLPTSENSVINASMFNKMFSFHHLALAVSLVSNYISQLVDVHIFLWIKNYTKSINPKKQKHSDNKYFWVRSGVSTLIAIFTDTVLVISLLTYFNILPSHQLFRLTANAFIYKSLTVFMMLPILQKLFIMKQTYTYRASSIRADLPFLSRK